MGSAFPSGRGTALGSTQTSGSGAEGEGRPPSAGRTFPPEFQPRGSLILMRPPLSGDCRLILSVRPRGSDALRTTLSCRIRQNSPEGACEGGRGLSISFYPSRRFTIMNKMRVRHSKSDASRGEMALAGAWSGGDGAGGRGCRDGAAVAGLQADAGGRSSASAASSGQCLTGPTWAEPRRSPAAAPAARRLLLD